MKAILITIGDEILSGNTVDTNSNFIANELSAIGISVDKIFTVPDNIEVIKKTLADAFKEGDLVISTGGIGPTKDDRTKKAYQEFFNDELVTHQRDLKHLRTLLTKRNREHLFEINKAQAETLSKATVFQNEHGTAPCQMIEEDGKTAIFLPGVPFEVKPLIREKIIPYLRQKWQLGHIVSRIISVVNMPESLLSNEIEKWELNLPGHIKLSYLPVGNRIKLRLTATGSNSEALAKDLAECVEELKPYIERNVISWDGNDIQETLKTVLSARNLTVSTAESCTGGGIARLITSVSGSGSYFLGGIVTYDAHKKTEILNVSEKTVREKTVVSKEVAQEMSAGCQKLFKTDISIATTGVAGPGEDEFGNEVGLVYYSIRIKEEEKTVSLFLPHLDRNDFMNFVSQRVLQDLVELLTAKNS